MKAGLIALLEGSTLTQDMALNLLENLDEQVIKDLQWAAREKAISNYGKRIYLRGLIEFTNYCQQDCYYCGLRHSNKEVERYRLSEEAVLACCAQGDALGYETFVLQGGDDPYFTDERLVKLIGKIKSLYSKVALTLSLGVRSLESYQRLREAGADRYLLRHETADPLHFAKLHPADQSFAQRAQALRDLRQAGFTIGAGMMIGSPGQTLASLAQDLVFLQELQPEMVGIGPFLPQHETPLGSYPKGSLELTLAMIAIVRILLPQALLPATTAVGSSEKDGRVLAVQSGANVIMPNLSPGDVRKNYAIYDNKLYSNEEAAEGLEALRTQMRSIGYHIDMSRGDPIGGNKK